MKNINVFVPTETIVRNKVDFLSKKINVNVRNTKTESENWPVYFYAQGNDLILLCRLSIRYRIKKKGLT